MARINLEDFSDHAVSRVYLAAKLAEAQDVEEVFNRVGVDYAVAIEPYKRMTIFMFSSEYKGAMFYVRTDQFEYCRNLLVDAGLSVGLIEEEEG